METLSEHLADEHRRYILRTTEGSEIIVRPHRLDIYGFDGVNENLLGPASGTFYIRDSIIGIEMENATGDVQLRPLAYAEDGPDLRAWIDDTNATLNETSDEAGP